MDTHLILTIPNRSFTTLHQATQAIIHLRSPLSLANILKHPSCLRTPRFHMVHLSSPLLTLINPLLRYLANMDLRCPFRHPSSVMLSVLRILSQLSRLAYLHVQRALRDPQAQLDNQDDELPLGLDQADDAQLEAYLTHCDYSYGHSYYYEPSVESP